MATKKRSKLITLVDVAFSAKDAKEKYGMKIGDHKLICSVLDAHLEEADENNEKFKTSLIADVVEVIGNELRPVKDSLKDIKEEVSHLRDDVSGIKDQVKAMGEENERVHENLKKQVDKIAARNRYWVIVLRLVGTAIITYFFIKYAHDHWWARNLLSVLGL